MKEHMVVREQDLQTLAKKALDYLASYVHTKASVILLEGDLGSGKTTFTQSLAKELGVEDYVQSPTFTLKKKYESAHTSYKKLIHIDAYRFNDPHEAKVLRLEDDMEDKESIIVIEWPSKMHEVAHDIVITFEAVDDTTRDVILSYEKNR